jgi:hypothetical protein
MNWINKNPFLVALIAITVLGTAITTYLAGEATARRAEAQTHYDAELGRLRTLEAKKPFPSAGTLAALKTQLDTYRTEIIAYQSKLNKMELKLAPINPQEFQDELRQAVNALQENAIKKNTTLPENFFYGFDEFRSTLPSDQQAPLLNREFQVIRTFVDELVALGVGSINALSRPPRVVKAPVAPPPPRPGQPAPKPVAVEEPAPALSLNRFLITFTAQQEKFLTVFNLIPASEQFLLVRSLHLENTNPVPPPRASTGAAPSLSNTPFGSPDADDSQKIQVVLGRESVKATLDIEILDFPEPPPPPK